MRKKVLSLMMVSALAVASLAGCGASEKKESGKTEKTGKTESDDPIQKLIDSTEGPVDLTLWCDETKEYQEVMKEICDGFKAKYSDVDINITIGAVSAPDMKDRVLADVEAAADVFTFPDD